MLALIFYIRIDKIEQITGNRSMECESLPTDRYPNALLILISEVFYIIQSQIARMTASKQSDEPDSDVLRLEKFRIINKRGHASHSSIQDIMYYGSEGEDLSVLGELL